MKEYAGQRQAQGLRIALVVSRFNSLVTDRLLAGALDALRGCGAREEDLAVVKVPGSFELPWAAEQLAASGRFQALVCLGALIRGETPHFDFIAREVARGIAQVGRQYRLPVAFGVLTADTPEQALNRAGGKYGNKGSEAALAAVEMARLQEQLKGPDGAS